jgi:hypothetical protein
MARRSQFGGLDDATEVLFRSSLILIPYYSNSVSHHPLIREGLLTRRRFTSQILRLVRKHRGPRAVRCPCFLCQTHLYRTCLAASLSAPHLNRWLLCHISPLRQEKVNLDDLERAVRSLRGMGRSLEIVSVAGRPGKMIQSVPVELSQDHTAVLATAGDQAYTSVPALQVVPSCNSAAGILICSGEALRCGRLQAKLGWHEQRAVSALDFLLDEGMAWVDLQERSDRQIQRQPAIRCLRTTSRYAIPDLF